MEDTEFNTPTETNDDDLIIKPIIHRSSKRKVFSPEEDMLLTKIVGLFGNKNWAKIAKFFPGKNVRQVREHYFFSLQPNINRTPWTNDEDELLLKLHQEHGSRWVFFQDFFENRTSYSIKNRFRTLTKYTPFRHYPVNNDEKSNTIEIVEPQIEE